MNLLRPLTVLAILATAIILSLVASNRKPMEVAQPLPFSHSAHVEEQDLECTVCHTQVTEHWRATLPGLEICQECHLDPITESEVEDELLAYTTADREIPWRRIYRVPDHVYFSHRRHVTLGEVPCESCHGDMRKLTEPPPFSLVAMTMDNCMKCHEEHQVTNDCLSCHR